METNSIKNASASRSFAALRKVGSGKTSRDNVGVLLMPWQERPAGVTDVLWRYSENPVLSRRPIASAKSIYNSAVVRYRDRFAGVFRADYHNGIPYLHCGMSDDGVDWRIDAEPIMFEGGDAAIATMEYAYDPRVCRIDDTYYITWCNGYHGVPTIGLGYTYDFQRFYQMENAFLPFNRNGVLFPRKINGHYAMLSRPSDKGHTPFGDIYYSESPDLTFWGKHRFVMGAGGQWWQGVKIGAGPVPIETREGWLLFYHGVMGTCSGFVYHAGAALLDLDEPWKVRYRSNRSLLSPEEDYETRGHVDNVIFPCAAVVDEPTGRVALYYGAADTYTCIAFARLDEVVDFVKANSEVF